MVGILTELTEIPLSCLGSAPQESQSILDDITSNIKDLIETHGAKQTLTMNSKQANGKHLAFIVTFCVLSWLAAGCASQGEFRGQGTATGVQLSGNNYKLLKAGARGQSSGFRLLGIIPFASPNYADAKEALYESVGEPLTGRSVALANQTEDRSSLYLILFSIPRVTITADVVEFTDKAQPNTR